MTKAATKDARASPGPGGPGILTSKRHRRGEGSANGLLPRD